MTPTARTHQEQTICRAVGPRAVRRALECHGGPLDGERRALEADEDALHYQGGSYAAVVCVGPESGSTEHLQWISD